MVTACSAPDLARPSAVTWLARGGGAGEVSTRGAMGEARGKVSGRGSHRSDGSSTGWWKAAFDGDVPGWRRRAVPGSDLGALLRLREGKETVRRRGNEEEDVRQLCSPIEEDGGESGSKSDVLGGGFRQRGRHTATPHRGAGGGVVLFGRCRTVEGKAKEACGGLPVEAKRENERRSGGQRGVPRGEEEEGGWHARHEGHGEGGGRARGRQRRAAAVRCGHAKRRQGRRGVLTGGPGAYSNGRR
jgi:hypothetical protein